MHSQLARHDYFWLKVRYKQFCLSPTCQKCASFGKVDYANTTPENKVDIKKLITENYSTIIVLILFIAAFYVRVELNGVDKDYPGNIKAANAFQWTESMRPIVDEGKIFTVPAYSAGGHSDVANVISQHEGLIAAPLIKTTQIEEWNIMYFIVSFLSAFSVVFLFIIIKKLLQSELIALLSAAMLVAPLNMGKWFYYTYIGIWAQSDVLVFLLAGLAMVVSYFERKRYWKLISISLICSAIFLLHAFSLFYLLPYLLIIFIQILRENAAFKLKLKNIISYTLPPIVAAIIFLPILLLNKLGPNKSLIFKFAQPDSHESYAVALSGFNMIILILFVVSLILLLRNYKKYTQWLLFTLFYFFTIYILPYFVHGGQWGYYIERTELFIPFVVLPTVAYGVFHLLIRPIGKMAKISANYLTLAVVLIVVLIGMPSFFALEQGLSHEHIDATTYDAFLWIQENTPKDAKVLIHEGPFQYSSTYTLRERFIVSPPDIQARINAFAQNQMINFSFEVQDKSHGFDNIARWSHWQARVGYMSFEAREEPKKKWHASEFEIIFLRNLDEMVAAYNQHFAQTLIEEFNYTVAYNNNGLVILQKQQ